MCHPSCSTAVTGIQRIPKIKDNIRGKGMNLWHMCLTVGRITQECYLAPPVLGVTDRLKYSDFSVVYIQEPLELRAVLTASPWGSKLLFPSMRFISTTLFCVWPCSGPLAGSLRCPVVSMS